MSQNPPVENEPGFPEGALPETVVFDILSNKRRRECITLLIQRSDEDAVSAWMLSHAVATALSDKESPSKKFQHSVYVSLIQTHLTKLADHDVIEYAEADKSILPGENLTALEPFLDISTPAPEGTDADDAASGAADTVSHSGAADDGSPAASEEGLLASSVAPAAIDSSVVWGGYLLVSLAVATGVLLVAISEPTIIPDELRVVAVVLLLVAIGFVVAADPPSGTIPFFE